MSTFIVSSLDLAFSNYNIPINFHTEEGFQIDLNCFRVEGLLSEINVNKATGPDGIHGRFLIVQLA